MNIGELANEIESDLIAGKRVVGTISCKSDITTWYGRSLSLKYNFKPGSVTERLFYDSDDDENEKSPIEIAESHLQDYMRVLEIVIYPHNKETGKVEIYIDYPNTDSRDDTTVVDGGKYSDFVVIRDNKD